MSTLGLFMDRVNNSYKLAGDQIMDSHPATGSAMGLISSYATWATLWFALLLLFVVLNLKTMPFVWTLRIINSFRFVCRSQRPAVALGPSHIFQPLITSASAPLMEIDFNLHKSNSSYFADADIARSHLMCTLFSRGVAEMRGGTYALTPPKYPAFGLALAAVSCSFKREVKPYEKYEMWTRILAWDEKWVYIVTHFVRNDAVKPRKYSLYPDQLSAEGNGARQAEKPADDKALIATALSKCVWKSGRKTILPEHMLQISGLLPVRGEYDGADEILNRVEQERVSGMVAAHTFATHNQLQLDAAFPGSDCEALGRHSDDSGIRGIIGTGLNLAHLSKSVTL